MTFPLALQRQWEISREYAMFATPVGYLIDADGIVAAGVATGPEAILALFPGAAAARRCGCGQPLGECGCGKSAQAAAVKQNGQ